MKWTYLMLLSITFSCSPKRMEKTDFYNEFPLKNFLKSEVIRLDSVALKYPFRISIHNTNAIILDIHNKEYYFHVFTYPDFKHIVSFGKVGNGPEEILLAENFRYINNDTIWILDANKMQISRWSISISERIAKQCEKIQLDSSLIRTLDFIYLNDSSFIVPDYTGSARTVQITKNGKILKKMGYIPTDNQYVEVAPTAVAQAWRSFIDYNKTNKIFAVVSQLGEVLEIYDVNGNLTKILYGPNGVPDFEITNGYVIPTGIMGFSDVKITDKYIYAVFHGHSFKEIANRMKKGAPSIDGGKYIYVFSLTGEPVCSYTLDRYIYGIDVNEEKGIITAVDVNSDEPIVQFKI